MSRVLGRLPALATVGVGSLPFTDGAAAVRHASRAYDVPFCPQLPALDGNMIDEWLGSDPARCGWTPDRDRSEPRAWAGFTHAVADRPPRHAVVKLQVTGPLTLAAGLQRASGSTGYGRASRALAREIATWLAANAAEQVRTLRELGLDALLVVDEPGLAHLAAQTVDEHVWDPLRAAAPAWGLHVCGPLPWDVIDAARPDLLSYDAVRYALDDTGVQTLGALIERGGRVAFGAVDPVRPDGPVSAADRVRAARAQLSGRLGRPVAELAGSFMLSPACGTGRLSQERERLVAAQLGAAALLLRDFATPSRTDARDRAAPRPQSTGPA